MAEAMSELKTMKTIERRQQKALQHYEAPGNDIQSLIARREDEIRSLTLSLRNTKERMVNVEADLKKANKKILALQDENTKLSSLVENENLGERDDLLQKVQQLVEEIKEKDAKIAKLERALELENKLRLRHEKVQEHS